MDIATFRRVAPMRLQVSQWKANGHIVGVVPTMGALHDGHLSLVRAARENADRVIVTIFVNPKQFNNADDLTNYPRTEESDKKKLAPFGVDAIYAPAATEIYPEGFSTNISVANVSDGLCGAHRPGHFDGVATVVTKLLLQTGADVVFFGEKDFQQLKIVKRLVRDLDIPTRIFGCPTVRDKDNLAMSSRNSQLSARDRAAAPALYQAISAARDKILSGQTIESALQKARSDILAAGFADVEYLELRDEADLQPTNQVDKPARLLVAATIGGVRLIDNIQVP
jgi:pantoate--beta-alanine ligase